MATNGKKTGEHPLYPSQIHAPQLIPLNEDGKKTWLITEDVEPTLPNNFEITDLEFVEIFSDAKSSLTWGEVLDRVNPPTELGLSDIPRFLTLDLEILQITALEYGMLFFPGTKLVDSFGEEHYPCLLAFGDEWEVIFVSSDDQLNRLAGQGSALVRYKHR